MSLAAITCFGGTVSYGFFWGMSLLPVVSLGYIIWVYFRFKIYQEIGSRSMVCGRPESYFFTLKNEDYFAYAGVSVRLFSDFSHVEELPGDVEYELLPGGQYTFETRLVCRYRGEYEVGVKEVVVTDFLRLFRISYSNPSTIKALVIPRIVSLAELKSLEDFQTVLRREAFSGTKGQEQTGHFRKALRYMVPAVLAGYVLLLLLDNAWSGYRYRRMCPRERFWLEVSRNLRLLALLGMERREWETLQDLEERCRLRGGFGAIRFIGNYESVVYGGRSVSEEMIREAAEERTAFLEVLKQEKRWAYVRWRVRMCLIRYR